ncbi:MAG: hypothetical protein QNJ40_19580 [Xanthomonadales bacterium]|nr:hypothetical protein [Xanthomonadales bacterium]
MGPFRVLGMGGMRWYHLAMKDSPNDPSGSFPNIAGYTIEKLLSNSQIPLEHGAAKQTTSEISVFLAKANGEPGPIAVKVLPAGWALDTPILLRFAELRDKNLITLRAAGHFDWHGEARSYVAVEYLSGDSLSRLLGSQRLDPQRTVAIMKDVCRALCLIHGGQLEHGNVKTDNILFRSDGTAVLNFSRRFRLGPPVDPSGNAAASTRGRQADLSALGLVFFEMLEGHPPPRSGRTIKERRLSRSKARFQPIVDGLLVRKSNLRFTSVDEVVERLS